MDSMFEQASRMKLRIGVPRVGQLAVEDLWDLSQEQLDAAYRELLKSKEVLVEPGLLQRKTSVKLDATELALELVKHVFTVRGAERDARLAAAERKEKREKLMALIAEKKDEGLKAASVEELQKQLAELE